MKTSAFLIVAALVVSFSAHAQQDESEHGHAAIAASELGMMKQDIAQIAALADRAMVKSESVKEDEDSSSSHQLQLFDYLKSLQARSQALLNSASQEENLDLIDPAFVKVQGNLELAKSAANAYGTTQD